MSPQYVKEFTNSAETLLRHCKDRGEVLNQQDRDGWTALHHAVGKGFTLACKFLLDQPEIDVTLLTKEGKTAKELLNLDQEASEDDLLAAVEARGLVRYVRHPSILRYTDLK